MAVNSFDSGQPLALARINVPSDASWGPNTQVLVRSGVHDGKFGLRLEAVHYTGGGSGSIVVKDAFGVELFSGATVSGPTRIHSALPQITVAAPLQITVTSGSSGAIYFYGQVL